MLQRLPFGLVVIVCTACNPTVDTDTVDPGTDADTDTEADTSPDTGVDTTCSPALEAVGGTVSVTGLLTITATGGTGDYRFEALGEGEVNALSGVYFAPLDAGPQQIRVTDTGCDGEAVADVDVVSRMQVIPETASVLPGTSLQLDVQGGSGLFHCNLLFGDGTVTEGCRAQVPSEGSLIVRVTDEVTGDGVDATLTADPTAGFDIDPGQMLVLPVGAMRSITPIGGTGWVGLYSTSPAVQIAGEAIVGVAPGTASVRVQDLYTSEERDLIVEVVEPLAVPDPPWTGESSRIGGGFTLGDVDGDGAEDIYFGDWEPSIDAHRGGALVHVSVTDGATGSLEALHPGQWPDERVGQSLSFMDADADGLDDIVLSAWAPDDVASDTGRVDIYRRTATGFETEPMWRFYGDPGERAGDAVDACDVDGDGYDDLIVGIMRDEDRSPLQVQSDQGALWVFRGGPQGLETAPSEIRYGEVWSFGSWEYSATLNLGRILATGDVNGDGLCDVAVSNPNRRVSAEGVNGGMVYVYLGDEVDGLSLHPSFALEQAAITNEFGFAIALGDLTGDGLDELVVTEPRYEPEDEGRDRGAAYIYEGSRFLTVPDAGAAPWTPADASWTVQGLANNDFLGERVLIDDADGDGVDELLIGTLFSEWARPDQANDSGNVVAFSAASIQADLAADITVRSADEATHLWRGPDTAAGIGTAFALLEDYDGDGWSELIARGGRDDTLGRDVGQYWILSSMPDGVRTALGYVGHSSGTRIGDGLTAVRSGRNTQIIVGSPDIGLDGRVRTGQITAFDAETGNLVWSPVLHSLQTDGDRTGWSVAPGGDVDGDGLGPDLVVSAYDDERPANYDNYNPTACEVPRRNNTGAAFVYRRTAEGSWAATPSGVAYGPWVNGRAWRVTGGYDFDGDGLDDVVMSGDAWYGNTIGGVRVAFGQELDDGLTLMCDTVDLQGTVERGSFGRSIAGLGDLDGDGCDELAVGAYGDSFAGTPYALNRQGIVRVFFGIGEGCATRGVVHLMSQENNAQGGFAMASGDLDGDGLDDLAVGLRAVSPETDTVGAVWVVPGSELVSRLGTDWFEPMTGVASVPDPLDVDPTFMTRSSDSGLAVWGRVAANFGEAVAIVPSASSDSGMALAVGAPFDDVDGLDAGEVSVYRWVNGSGLDRRPMVRAVSDAESARTGGSVAGEGGWLVYGALYSDALGADRGAAFAVELP